MSRIVIYYISDAEYPFTVCYRTADGYDLERESYRTFEAAYAYARTLQGKHYDFARIIQMI